MTRETMQGSCHCGAVRFKVEIDVESGLFVSCNCSLCRRKNRGVAVISADQFTLLDGENMLSVYRWNTGREKHYFCKQCGIHTHHTLAGAPPRIGINLACIEGFDPSGLQLRAGDGASIPLVSGERFRK